MVANIKHELLAHLKAAEVIEQQSLRLIRTGIEHAGDEQIADIHRTYCRQTEEHVRLLAGRIPFGATLPASEDLVTGPDDEGW